MSHFSNQLASSIGAALLCSSLLQAQSPSMENPSTQQQPPSVTQNTGGEPQDAAPSSGVSGQMMKDKMFLRKATQGGLAEIELGQLTAQKAGSQDVKDAGRKMVTDHTDLNDELKPIADSLGVMLPKKLSARDQAESDKLKGMSGSEFDTEYLTYMARDHHEDLREFRTEVASTTDPTLKAAVEKGARVIREHAHMLEALAQSKGIVLPLRGPHAAVPASSPAQP